MSNPEKSGDGSDFDFAELEGEDPFGDKAGGKGGSDPFDFSAEDSAKTKAPPKAPSPPKAPPAPKAAKKAPPQPSSPPPAASSTPPAPAAGSSKPSRGASASMAGLAEDVPVQVVAVLGKKSVTVGDLISMKKGEVVELNRFPNEAVDLVANGKLMAKGELVEIDGKLGVRIIKIF